MTMIKACAMGQVEEENQCFDGRGGQVCQLPSHVCFSPLYSHLIGANSTGAPSTICSSPFHARGVVLVLICQPLSPDDPWQVHLTQPSGYYLGQAMFRCHCASSKASREAKAERSLWEDHDKK